jgi:orotate phosphoribosyltransferase
MRTESTREKLRSLLAERALIVGPITLSNGSLSNHYFDCKKVTLSSEGAALAGEAVLDAILALPEPVKAIGGLTHGADPIIGAVMMCARARGLTIDGFYVRKEPKQHGTKSLVENAPPPGTNVVVVDDVVTAGGSVLKAIDGAKLAGCRVAAVITLVDRLEGGGDKIKEKVADYRPLFTLDDFRSDIETRSHANLELLSAGASR